MSIFQAIQVDVHLHFYRLLYKLSQCIASFFITKHKLVYPSRAPSFKMLQNPIHLYRASCFMEWCAVERPGTELHRPDRPASLFEGLLGRIYLAEDLTHILEAKFPAFTV